MSRRQSLILTGIVAPGVMLLADVAYFTFVGIDAPIGE